jgi:hypothetical protein
MPKNYEFNIMPRSMNFRVTYPMDVLNEKVILIGDIKFECKENGTYKITLPFTTTQRTDNPDVNEAVLKTRTALENHLAEFGEKLKRAWNADKDVFNLNQESQLELFEKQLGIAKGSIEVPKLDDPDPNIEFTSKDLEEASDELPFDFPDLAEDEEDEPAVDDEPDPASVN